LTVRKEILYSIIMPAELGFTIRIILVFIAGNLISNGYLSVEHKDAFINDSEAFTGNVITAISLLYVLHHGYLKVKSSLNLPQNTSKLSAFLKFIKSAFVKETTPPTVTQPIQSPTGSSPVL